MSWRYIENEVEGVCFRLNDIYWQEFVPQEEQLAFLRHKERKFGRGCIDQWRGSRKICWPELEQRLVPFEEMLMESRSCWMNSRGSWISTFTACWAISFFRAITTCPPSYRLKAMAPPT